MGWTHPIVNGIKQAYVAFDTVCWHGNLDIAAL
jgi:hypothetical protein